jgi:hypothetical protein
MASVAAEHDFHAARPAIVALRPQKISAKLTRWWIAKFHIGLELEPSGKAGLDTSTSQTRSTIKPTTYADPDSTILQQS